MNKLLKRKLKNGIQVVMEERDLPVVSLSITNTFGGAYESKKIKGVAHFIEHLLFTGTSNRTSEQISREIEKKGGILNAFTSHEVTSFWFKIPSEHVFTGLEILADMLNNPLFENEKFDKEKKVILEEIKMYHDNPRLSAFEQLEKNMFESPFGDLIIGSKETVSALKRDEVYEIFKNSYSPENYIVTIVGKADFDKICAFLEKNFVSKGKKAKMLKIVCKNSETIQDREGIDQAHLVFAIHAPLANTDDFYALKVLDAYLAEGMSSRLFLEIREKRGLAYSVKSDFGAEKEYSTYTIYVGTTKEAVSKVKELIIKEFENVKNMTEKDLIEAKQMLLGLRKISSEESANVMNELMFEQYRGNGEEYYNFEKRINGISLEQVKKVAKVKDYSISAIVPK
jgi:predicted Zn-dependent peptidase